MNPDALREMRKSDFSHKKPDGIFQRSHFLNVLTQPVHLPIGNLNLASWVLRPAVYNTITSGNLRFFSGQKPPDSEDKREDSAYRIGGTTTYVHKV